MIRDEDIIEITEPKLTAADKLYLPQFMNGLKTTFRHLFTKRITFEYPEQRRPLRKEIHRGVHRLNRDEQGRVACVACFMCPTICPAQCIYITAAESPWSDREKYPVQFDIDELMCIYCGMCEEACPVDAIELTTEYSVVGLSRKEMIFDINRLLEVFDRTRDIKPRKNPPVTGYPGTGGTIPPSPPPDQQRKESGKP